MKWNRSWSVVVAVGLGLGASWSCRRTIEETVDRRAICDAWCVLRMDENCGPATSVLESLDDCKAKCVDAPWWGPCETERAEKLTCETDLGCDGMREVFTVDGAYEESECWDLMTAQSACKARSQGG